MLASGAPISYRQLPLRLYQVGPKFRDELKARFGLIRAKEFYMKDMYTFDMNVEKATQTYEQLNEAYNKLFEQLQVPFVRGKHGRLLHILLQLKIFSYFLVKASTGLMGGKLSHEFHYISPSGEDRIMQCNSCNYTANAELTEQLSNCPNCKASRSFNEVKGIEVGHAFLLGEKYSAPFGATFLNEKGKPQNLIMGCYGIGVSRLLAASLEVLSTENELRWPTLLAPYDVCIIGPKQGSKEQENGDVIEEDLCNSLRQFYDQGNDVLHDDRKYLTIGKRLMEAKRWVNYFKYFPDN